MPEITPSNLVTANHSYYSHGKLLISGEYFVLQGAKALAIPLKQGQKLTVKPIVSDYLLWESYYNEQIWFEAKFDNTLNIVTSSDIDKATVMSNILKAALLLANNTSPQQMMSLKLTHQLEFDPNWGWGSSSTLIYNLSQWLGIDAFELSKKTLGGSHYDIACAGAISPIFYRLNQNNPVIESAPFHPPFANQLFFVYLGKKQDSRYALKSVNMNSSPQTSTNELITSLTEQMAECTNFDEFKRLMVQHEKIVSDYISQSPIKETLFGDFNGQIKSCGAWGGDFVLAAGNDQPEEILNYFKTKGHPVLFNFNKIILNKA